MKDRESIKQSSSLNLKIVGHYRRFLQTSHTGQFCIAWCPSCYLYLTLNHVAHCRTMSQCDFADTIAVKGLARPTPSLLFSIHVREIVWGVGLLESAAAGKDTASLDLHPPWNHTDTTLPMPQVIGEIRGKLLLGVEWKEGGANLELHSIRSLVLPVPKLYALKARPINGVQDDLTSPVSDSTTVLWTLQIWGLPPAFAESTGIPICKIEVPEAKLIPFTEHKLKLERPVEVFWPETWSRRLLPETESDAVEVSQISFNTGVEVAQPNHGLTFQNVAMRCRQAMFEGANENGATARSLKHWAEIESWFLFSPHYSRYDDELLPIDEITALHPEGDFTLTESDLLELRQDENYLFCHSTVVRLVLLSWGWDTESGELRDVDGAGGQGWEPSGSHAWRLRHLCLSCWLLGQVELRQTCNDFVMSLGMDAPWTEDGFAEATFTLEDAQKARQFWDTRPQPSPSLRILQN